jgi:acetolactate synthase-1/2/3 large subunit
VKGSTAISQILKAEGCEYLYCFPNNELIDAVALEGIKPIMTRTERTAVGMAEGQTRVTGGKRIGVCAFQNGPGIENAFGGVAQAFSDSTPLLVLARGEHQRRLHTPTTFDAVQNFGHVTKWAARITHADRIPELMRRAYTQLRAGSPAPVLLEVPQEIMAADAAPGQIPDYTPVRGVRMQADPDAVASAVETLLAAKRPLIHAGQGVLYSGATPELVELAELLAAGVMTTLPGKSAFPEDHPLALGAGGRTGTLAAARFLTESDLIFGVGSSLSVSGFAAPIPKGKAAIQLTVNEVDLNKDYPLDHLLLGDAKLVLRQVIEEVKSRLGPDGRRGDDRTARDIRAVHDEWLAEWMPKLTSDEVPINPYRVVWELQQHVDLRNTVATHDAGSPRDQMAPFWRALVPHSYIGWGKSTHLGYGLALAMGAKLARPDRTVLNIMGDAAFGMIGMDVETAARNQIGTLTIVMNNSCLGGYDKYLHNATERYRTRYLSGDYTKVASGLGAYTERVQKPGDLGQAVGRALAATREGQPAVLEVITCEDNAASRYWQ